MDFHKVVFKWSVWLWKELVGKKRTVFVLIVALCFELVVHHAVVIDLQSVGFINALIHYLTCVTRKEKGTTMDLWQQVLIETKNKSKMHQGLADNVSNDIVNRFMIISDDCKRISKHVRVYNYLNPLTQSVISTLFLPTISLLNHTLRSWEYRKWSSNKETPHFYKQLLLDSTIGNVKRTVWIYVLMLGCIRWSSGKTVMFYF